MHIHYINLAKSTDRNTVMKHQLQNYNHKRIEAYNGENYMEYVKINDHPHNKPNTNACIASHLYAIKTAYDDGLEEVLVIEDDINLEILDQTWEELQLIWNCHKEEMDILQIHSASGFAVQNLYVEVLQKGEMKMVDKVGNYLHCWQTTGYIIKRTGMERFMHFYNQKAQIFDMTSYKGINVADIILYVACKTKIINLPFINIFNPVEVTSTIQSNLHIELAQKRPYTFIEQYKQQFITIIKHHTLIPRIMHIYYTEAINNTFFMNIKKYYPKWKLNIWNEATLHQFIEENYPDYVERLNGLEDKEAFFKYIAVYHFGGFYIRQELGILDGIEKYLTRSMVVFNEEWTAFGGREKQSALKERLDGLV